MSGTCCCFLLVRQLRNLMLFNNDPEGRLFSTLWTVSQRFYWKNSLIISVMQRANLLWWMSLKGVFNGILYPIHDVGLIFEQYIIVSFSSQSTCKKYLRCNLEVLCAAARLRTGISILCVVKCTKIRAKFSLSIQSDTECDDNIILLVFYYGFKLSSPSASGWIDPIHLLGWLQSLVSNCKMKRQWSFKIKVYKNTLLSIIGISSFSNTKSSTWMS